MLVNAKFEYKTTWKNLGRAKSFNRDLSRPEALCDLLLVDRTLFDQTPVWLRDIYGRCALAGANTAIDDQVNAAVHHSKYFDAAAAGRMAGDICAGADEGLIQKRDDLLSDLGARLAQSQAACIAGDLKRHLGGCRHDERQRTRPKAPGENEEAIVQLGGKIFGHHHVAYQ